MDRTRFDALTWVLTAPGSRRHAVAGLLAGALSLLHIHDAQEAIAHDKTAKCKKLDDRDKKKKCLKQAKRHRAQHRRRSASPVPVLTYQCPGPSATAEEAIGPDYRFAQTFTAAQGGSLLKIQFAVIKDAASSGDWIVQLLAVGTDGKPSNTALAEVTIPNASVPVGPSTLTASFSEPVLVSGTRYAAAISRPGGSGFLVKTRTGNACAGSAFRQQPTGSNPFDELTIGGGVDFLASVTVLV
jgi:hypothetical protein